MKIRKIFKTALIIFICTVVFSASAYAYLYTSLKSDGSKADTKNESIPYYSLPYNCGIMFALPEGGGCLMYLDFENSNIQVYFTDLYTEGRIRYGDYSVDYTVELDYKTIAGIIDRVGGITMDIDGETLRFTGIQVLDIITETTESEDIKRKIVSQILLQISKNGFSKEDFVYIIENSGTDLLVPDCFYWQDYIAELCENAVILN